MAYQDVFQWLVDLGLLDVILPFILVFTVTYALLQNTKLFGVDKDEKPKKKINAMVAFVMGFFAVLATNLLNAISIILSYFVLLLVIGLMLALVFGLSGAEVGKKNKVLTALLIFFAILFTLLGLANAGVIDMNRFWDTIFLPALVLGLLAFGIYYMFGKKKQPPSGTQQSSARPASRQGRTVSAGEIPTGGEVEL